VSFVLGLVLLRSLGSLSPSAYCFLFFALAGVVLVFALLLRRAVHLRLAGAVFFVAGSLALLGARWPSLLYDKAINPDEGLMGANAMLARGPWLNWDIVDPLTAGPLDSIVLAWPRWLGLDITFFNIRLTGIILVCAALALLFGVASRFVQVRGAIVAVFPVFAFLIYTKHGDFVNYASEMFPILLIAIGVFLLVENLKSGRMASLYFAALALGFVPFAKLQGTPIAAVVGLLVAAAAFRGQDVPLGRKVARAVSVLIVSALPTLLFLVPLALSGGLDDFFKSYFIQQKLRFDNDVWINRLPQLLRTTSFGWLVASYAALLVVTAASLFSAFMSRRTLSLSTEQTWLLALAALMLPATYFAVTGSGREFPHYLIFAIPLLVVFATALLALIAGSAGPSRKECAIWLAVSAAAAGVVLLPGLTLERPANQPWSRAWSNGLFLHGRAFESVRSLRWLLPEAEDRMLCWGWRADCYVDSAMPPATREATNENQLYNTVLQPYFRDRFIQDLERTRPAYIVDFVAPGGFYFQDSALSGIASFAALKKFVDADYRLVSSVADEGSCPRVYAEKSRAERLDRSKVAFASVIAAGSRSGTTPDAVDDGSIFETCLDYWLAPDGRPGALDLPFEEPSPVKRILLLNTRNGIYADRGSLIVRLALRSGGEEIWTRFVELQWFPNWTTIVLDQPIPSADALHIDVLAYWGYSGGLNEVKVYRD